MGLTLPGECLASGRKVEPTERCHTDARACGFQFIEHPQTKQREGVANGMSRRLLEEVPSLRQAWALAVALTDASVADVGGSEEGSERDAFQQRVFRDLVCPAAAALCAHGSTPAAGGDNGALSGSMRRLSGGRGCEHDTRGCRM